MPFCKGRGMVKDIRTIVLIVCSAPLPLTHSVKFSTCLILFLIHQFPHIQLQSYINFIKFSSFPSHLINSIISSSFSLSYQSESTLYIPLFSLNNIIHNHHNYHQNSHNSIINSCIIHHPSEFSYYNQSSLSHISSYFNLIIHHIYPFNHHISPIPSAFYQSPIIKFNHQSTLKSTINPNHSRQSIFIISDQFSHRVQFIYHLI